MSGGVWGMIITAAVGSVLAGTGAHRNNQALRTYAKDSQRRLNDTITQIRVDRMRNTSQLAREAQVEQGAVLNIAPHNQGVMQALAVRLAGGVASDQFAINETAKRGEAAVEAQKRDVVNHANSQMKNVHVAALEGAVAGAQAGAAIGGAVDQYRASQTEAKNTTTLLQHGEVMRDFEKQISIEQLEGAKATTNYYRNLNSVIELQSGQLQFDRFQRTNNTPFRFYTGY